MINHEHQGSNNLLSFGVSSDRLAFSEDFSRHPGGSAISALPSCRSCCQFGARPGQYELGGAAFRSGPQDIVQSITAVVGLSSLVLSNRGDVVRSAAGSSLLELYRLLRSPLSCIFA